MWIEPTYCPDCHEPESICQCSEPVAQPSYADLAARLAEAERLLRAGVENAEDFAGSDRGFPLEEWATQARHYFDLRATGSASVSQGEK